MNNLKKQNPNASWTNLLTGAAVLVMVVVFSFAYFNKTRMNNRVIDDSSLVEDITSTEPENAIQFETAKQQPKSSVDTTIVQKGEGLWHVAQRVCGDNEKYNILAQANGLSVWEELNEGMTLKVVCN